MEWNLFRFELKKGPGTFGKSPMVSSQRQGFHSFDQGFGKKSASMRWKKNTFRVLRTLGFKKSTPHARDELRCKRLYTGFFDTPLTSFSCSTHDNFEGHWLWQSGFFDDKISRWFKQRDLFLLAHSQRHEIVPNGLWIKAGGGISATTSWGGSRFHLLGQRLYPPGNPFSSITSTSPNPWKKGKKKLHLLLSIPKHGTPRKKRGIYGFVFLFQPGQLQPGNSAGWPCLGMVSEFTWPV